MTEVVAKRKCHEKNTTYIYPAKSAIYSDERWVDIACAQLCHQDFHIIHYKHNSTD